MGYLTKAFPEAAVVQSGLPGVAFSNLLLKYYRDPEQKIGERSYDEEDIVAETLIVSFSFGSSCEFKIAPKGQIGYTNSIFLENVDRFIAKQV